MHWLTLIQGVWCDVSMTEELPENQHGSSTINLQQGFSMLKIFGVI
jgi:hypothetical protein